MQFKLIIAFVEDEKTRMVMQAAREAGATGATVVGNARGEGINPTRSFFGLTLESQRDMVLFLVESHLSRDMLETVSRAAEFETKPGTGIAIQLAVEDAIGVSHQIERLTEIMAKPVVSVPPQMEIRYCARLLQNLGNDTSRVVFKFADR